MSQKQSIHIFVTKDGEEAVSNISNWTNVELFSKSEEFFTFLNDVNEHWILRIR